MLRTTFVVVGLASVCLALAGGAQHEKPQPKKQDKSVHHAAMHAEHWIDHHMSAPHKKTDHKKAPAKPTKKKDRSVHHAAMHAEHWIDHHVSAPHKKKG